MSKQNLERTNWLGVCLLVIGIAYLYKNFYWDFHFLQNLFPHYFFSWQAILILVGFCLLLVGRSGGLLIMLLGAFFLFPHKILQALGHFHQWWPAVLIIIGLMILTRSRSDRKEIKN